MGITFIDGFDHYDDEPEMEEKWWSVTPNDGFTLQSDTNSRVVGSQYVKMYSDITTPQLTYQFPDSSQLSGFLGFAFNIRNSWSSRFHIWTTTNSNGNHPIGIYSDADEGRKLILYTGDYVPPIDIATGINSVQIGVWHYLEIRWMLAHDTPSGMFEVWLDGIKEINVTGNTHGYEGIADDILYFHISCKQSSSGYYDDVYVGNYSGTRNTGVLGPVYVHTLQPTGQGWYKEWTSQYYPSNTGNWQNVDDTFPDGDTTYVYGVYDSENDITDTYNYQNLPSNLLNENFYAVQVTSYVKKNGPDDVPFQNIVLPTGVVQPPLATIWSGDVHTLDNTSYSYFMDIWDENPLKQLPWSWQGINSSYYGIQIPGNPGGSGGMGTGGMGI